MLGLTRGWTMGSGLFGTQEGIQWESMEVNMDEGLVICLPG